MDWKNCYKYLVNCVYNLAYCLGRGCAKGNQTLLKQLNFAKQNMDNRKDPRKNVYKCVLKI